MKKDYYLVAIVGFLVGSLVLLPLKNSFNIGIQVSTVLLSVLGFSLFAPCALWVTKLFAKRWSVFDEFGKFAAVGTLNTLLDLAVLNGFIFFTGIEQGSSYALFKATSFLVATTNSYFWNKFWTFGNRAPASLGEYLRFALFTLGGTALNVGVATLIVNGIGAPHGVTLAQWANAGALLAVLVSFLWNFLTYRHIVFSVRGGSLPDRQAGASSGKSLS